MSALPFSTPLVLLWHSLACGIFGLGYGLVTPGINLWVGESYGDRRATALNIINLTWGLGAICSSPLAMWAQRESHVSLLMYLVGAFCVLLALALLRMPFGKPPKEDQPASQETSAFTPGLGGAILLGILFFVYVGTENSTSYWAPEHARRAANWASNTLTLAQCFSSPDY